MDPLNQSHNPTPEPPASGEPSPPPSISPEPAAEHTLNHTVAPSPVTPSVEPATTHVAATPPQPPAPQPVSASQVTAGAVEITPSGDELARGQHNAGMIVLQWLTYAFWGWTVLGLSILTYMVLANFIAGADTGGFTPYGIAAVLVLLPISYVVDSFYSRKEPDKKTGAETVVMVIHAVLFALFAIGSLICAVIALVQLFTERGESAGVQVFLWGSLIITAYYVLSFLRVLAPGPLSFMRKIYKWIMLVTVGVIALLGIIGPVAKQRQTRDDRLIERNLSTVQSGVNRYATKNNKLPGSLADITVDGDAKQLVDRNLVTYKPETTTSTLNLNSNTTGANRVTTTPSYSSVRSAAYKYQLCVTYKKESTNYSKYGSTYDRSSSAEEYQTYLSVYSHPKGEACYKLQTTNY